MVIDDFGRIIQNYACQPNKQNISTQRTHPADMRGLPFGFFVIIGVIQAKRRIDGGALVHELDRTTRVG